MRFRSIEPASPREAGIEFRFEFDGKAISARRGQTVAAALLEAGVLATRLAGASGKPHGPYCMMGACFECLVVVAGRGTFQACLLEAAEGMIVSSGGAQR